MLDKHAFSPGVLYIRFTFMHLADAFIQSDLLRLYIILLFVCGHEWNDVLFHNTKSYLNLKTHNIFLRCCFMTKNLKMIQI